jgi:protease I
MSGSHSLAEKYMLVPGSANTRGDPYPLPVFPDDQPDSLAGARVLFVSADGPELPEPDIPMEYLKARGATVNLAGQDWIFKYRRPAGYIVIAEWLSDNIGIKADLSLKDVNIERYDAIFIPGGAWNPDMLRIDGDALKVIREAYERGLMIVSLCHGPQVLISTNAAGPTIFLPGTRLTGVKNIRIDLENAKFVIEEPEFTKKLSSHDDPEKVPSLPVYDEKCRLLTARNPFDLGPLCEEMGSKLKQRISNNVR